VQTDLLTLHDVQIFSMVVEREERRRAREITNRVE
jgi:hypothetical protein